MKATVTCQYKLGRNVGTMPYIGSDVAGRVFSHVVGEHTYILQFPPVAQALATSVSDGHESVGVFDFTISVEAEVSSSVDAETELLPVFLAARDIAQRVSDSIWVKQPSVGLAGATPEVSSAVIAFPDKSANLLAFLGERSGRGMVLGWPVPNADDIEHALVSDVPTHQLLLAQAVHYLMGRRTTGGHTMAVTLAAVACELKIKQVVKSASPGRRRMIDLIVPEGKQAKVPMTTLLKEVVPFVTGRSIVTEHAWAWQEYVELVKARNNFAHSGKPLTEADAMRHVQAARAVLEWLESRGEPLLDGPVIVVPVTQNP